MPLYIDQIQEELNLPQVEEEADPGVYWAAKPLSPQIDRNNNIGKAIIHAWEFVGPPGNDTSTVLDIGSLNSADSRPFTITDRGAGAPAYAVRRHGYFLELGSTHRAEASADISNWFNTQRFSIEIFIELVDEAATGLPAIGVFWQPDGTQNTSLIEFSYNDAWYWGVRDADGNYAFPNQSSAATNGDYVHSILTCNGTNLRFYLNGVLANNGNLNLGTSDGVNSFSTNPLITASTPGAPGVGSAQQAFAYVDHVSFRVALLRIYNRPLSPIEANVLGSDPWLPVRNLYDFEVPVPLLPSPGGGSIIPHILLMNRLRRGAC